MEEPRIQYAQTSDGVSIGYWTLGDGPPIVQMYGMALGVLGSAVAPEARLWYERLARQRLLVRYDPRGFGQSEHGVAEFSLESWLLDLDAVMDQLHVERSVLFASFHSGPVAIAYAAKHPERVSHLILYCTTARGPSLFSPRFQAFEQVADSDWETYTELVAHANLGWEAGESARRYAAWLRESTTKESLFAVNTALRGLDATPFLPAVRCPTLVLHRRQVPAPGPEEARFLASRIPGAELVLLEGEAALLYLGDMEAVLEAVEDFLDGGDRAAQREARVPPVAESITSTASVLFADIADSTALTERMGDAAFRDRARGLDGSLRAAIASAGGTAIDGKLLGDGVLAVFTSGRQAIEAGLACSAGGAEAGLPLHIGVHAGDVIREENNVYGGAVNIAARIAGVCAPGEVLVSDVVRGLARTSAGVSFEDRGEHALKGVGEPQRLWAVVG